MDLPSLTGAQKTRLRSLGQKLDAMLMIGQAGATPTVLKELNGLLAIHELVKVRFAGADRDQRAELAATIAATAPCIHAGSVGGIALFYRQQPDPAKRKIVFKNEE
jgi:RNA-binding protein